MTDPAVQAEMAKYVYDKEREIERKAQLDRLLRRTPEQVKVRFKAKRKKGKEIPFHFSAAV